MIISQDNGKPSPVTFDTVESDPKIVNRANIALSSYGISLSISHSGIPLRVPLIPALGWGEALLGIQPVFSNSTDLAILRQRSHVGDRLPPSLTSVDRFWR